APLYHRAPGLRALAETGAARTGDGPRWSDRRMGPRKAPAAYCAAPSPGDRDLQVINRFVRRTRDSDAPGFPRLPQETRRIERLPVIPDAAGRTVARLAVLGASGRSCR